MLKTKTKEATTKILIFPVGELYLAVYLEDVQKVVRVPEIFSSGQKPVGVARFDQEEITILDLHKKIYADSDVAIANYSHLIVLNLSQQNPCGVPVTQLPIIAEIPLSQLHPLPDTYRHADTLGIASYTVNILQGENSITAFLISPNSLLELVIPALPSRIN